MLKLLSWRPVDLAAVAYLARKSQVLRTAAALALAAHSLAACSSKDEQTPAAAPQTCPKEGCARGEICLEFKSNDLVQKACKPLCDPTASGICPAGEGCFPIANAPGRAVCRPLCDGQDDCREGFSCDKASGLCRCRSDLSCDQLLDPLPGQSSACLDDGTCAFECVDDADCPCASVCGAGHCSAGCRSDSDCCGNSSCNAGRCSPAVPGPIGARCDHSREDCAKPGFCMRDLADRGMCVAGLANSCDVMLCPEGTVCVPTFSPRLQKLVAVCAPECELTSSASCPPSTRCSSTVVPEVAGCARVCESDADCGPDGSCDLPAGRCGCSADPWCQTNGPRATCDESRLQCTCTPDCSGKECGFDGCGGLCGTCEMGSLCDHGQCVRSCGGTEPYVLCEGSYACPPHSACVGDNLCQCVDGYEQTRCDGTPCPEDGCDWEWKCAPCRPQCSGRECGPDGCGGNCGSCSTGETCVDGNCEGGTTSGCTGCATNEVCVNSACAPKCSSSSDCSTGCCVGLIGGGKACVSASYCGSSTGGTGSRVSSCLTGLQKVNSSQANWNPFPAPFNGLDFKVYWSNSFSVYELIFRNRFQDRIYFNFEPAGGSVPTTTTYRANLSAGQAESPPGVSVRGAVDGGKACVLIDQVRFGADDGPYQ